MSDNDTLINNVHNINLGSETTVLDNFLNTEPISNILENDC